MMRKESIVFLKSDIAELISNAVCEGNITKYCKKQGKPYNNVNRILLLTSIATIFLAK